ncbi:MAG: lysophospholipid acyltransferase family protein [Bacteroidales bacterium]|nr:lysophospholipid acyltransferase family protein [Bacteroidales bacterium]
MKLLSTGIFLVFVIIIGVIPFRLLYIFSDLVSFVLYHVIGYRKKVVFENLTGCFPDKTEKEIIDLAKKSYLNLSDIIIESFKSFTMSKTQLVKRYIFTNLDVIAPYETTGQSIILAAGHHGNWEWSTVSAGFQLKNKMVGIYKPLSNKYMDRILRKSRERTNTTLCSIFKTKSTFSTYHNKSAAFMMAGDQNPGNLKKSIWIHFMGRPTAFLDGIERYAREYNLPVIFAEAHRVARGKYTIELTKLTDTPLELEKGRITQMYANKLEQIINDRPECWLWSHKRWKLTLPENTRVLG